MAPSLRGSVLVHSFKRGDHLLAGFLKLYEFMLMFSLDYEKKLILSLSGSVNQIIKSDD